MVVFTCNHCGESLKKNVVEKHSFRCRRNISVSCMDCFKDFDSDTHQSHTQCVTELERYSGKDYVAKPNQNKGQKKQEAWVDIVRNITEQKAYLSSGVKKILETISSYDNIPRKKAKFLNFMTNSFRYMKKHELEEAWTLLEEAMKESKASQNVATNGSAQYPTGKHKLDESIDADVSEPSSKKKKRNRTDETETAEGNLNTESPVEKFSWAETIKNILSAKNNEIKLKKLRKKVIEKYQSLTGVEWNEKLEIKFTKKINKLKGVTVDHDQVRLIE